MIASVPSPPVDMVVPSGVQWFFTLALAAVCAALVAWSLLSWRRTGSPLELVLLAGGALATLNEPLHNIHNGLFHPAIGQWTVFTAYDRPIPLWAIFGYTLYFGFGAIGLSRSLRSGVTLRRFWSTVGAVFVVNLLIEIPILGADLMRYYGPQPFEVLGLPLHQLVFNGLGALVVAAPLVFLPQLFEGARTALALLLPVLGYFASQAVGMGFFLAFSSDAPHGVIWLASAFSMVLALLGYHAVAWAAWKRSGAAPSARSNATGPLGAPKERLERT